MDVCACVVEVSSRSTRTHRGCMRRDLILVSRSAVGVHAFLIFKISACLGLMSSQSVHLKVLFWSDF